MRSLAKNFGLMLAIIFLLTVPLSAIGETVTANPSRINEAGGSSTLTLRLGSSTSPQTVTSDTKIYLDFSGSTATLGEDFTVSGETVTIRAGTNSVTATITGLDDSLLDPGEIISITATIRVPVFGQPWLFEVVELGKATVTIDDDDVASRRVDLSVSPSLVGEGAGSKTFRVTGTLDGAARTVSTSVSVSLGGQAATLRIPAGQTSGYVDVPFTPVSNDVDEPDRTLSVTGSTTATGLSVNGTSFTVQDDDPAPTITLV